MACTMVEEAERRKARLKALKRKINSQDQFESLESTNTLPGPIFRSYQPTDEKLKANQLSKILPKEVKTQVEDQLAASKPEPLVQEVDLLNLAPRKPDWDLKRDVAKKLTKLEKRTQKAIAELIRERLQEGKDSMYAAADANLNSEQLDDDDD